MAMLDRFRMGAERSLISEASVGLFENLLLKSKSGASPRLKRRSVGFMSGEPTHVNEDLVEVSAAPQPDMNGKNRLLQS